MTRFQIYILLLSSGTWTLLFAYFLLDSWQQIGLNYCSNDSRIKSLKPNFNINQVLNASPNHYTKNPNHSTLIWNQQIPIPIEIYFGSAENSLNAFPVIPQSQVKRFLLLSYYRSGSSFVGDLLQHQNQKSFYSFEPLHYMSRGVRSNESSVDQAIRVIDHIFRCKFDDKEISANWIKHHMSNLLRKVCRSYRNITACLTPKYLSQTCQRAEINVIKVIRLEIRHHLRILLPKLFDLNVHVVYLVRDPRGILNSRIMIARYLAEKYYWDIGLLCNEITDDINEFIELQKLYPNNLTLIRYEDIATNPYTETKALFDRLSIQFTSSAQQFISSHTNVKHSSNRNPYSIARNSKLVAYEWKQTLNVSLILEVQHKCKHLLQKLNYEFLKHVMISK